MAIDYDGIFADIGQIASARKHLKDAANGLGAHKLAAGTVLANGTAERSFLGRMLTVMDAADAATLTQAGKVADLADDYMENLLPERIDSAGQTVAAILADFGTAMRGDSETVKGNTVGVGTVAGSAMVNGSLTSLAATQMAVEDDLVLQCTSVATTNAELWSLASRSRQKTISGIKTGVAYPGTLTDYLGASFTVMLDHAGTQCFADDTLPQLLAAAVTGTSYGTNTDSERDLHLTISTTGGGSAIDLAGGTSAQVGTLTTFYQSMPWGSGTYLSVPRPGTSLDAGGTMYLAVTADTGTVSGTVFGAGGTEMIGHTAEAIGTNQNILAIVADGSSNLVGTFHIVPIGGTGLTDSGYTRHYRVTQTEFFKDASRGGSTLVAQTDWSATAGSHALREMLSSGLGGTLVTGSNILSGTGADNITLHLPHRFQVGEQFLWATTGTDAGQFQSFFRDQFGVTLPNRTDGSHTVDDTLAD